MFDGSYRTNKREINLAGASSSKSSRKHNLNVARQQRLARAQAKAKLNAIKCLQRNWRGCSTRECIAANLDDTYQRIVQDSHKTTGSSAGQAGWQGETSRAASLLAFRMSPALLPFFANHHVGASGAADALIGKKKWGAKDSDAEKYLRRDLLSFDWMLRHDRQKITPFIHPIAAGKIISITLHLLRQSIYFQSNGTEIDVKEQNRLLLQLVDHLLDYFSSRAGEVILAQNPGNLWSIRPGDYYMDVLRNKNSFSASGWMINIFLCFRDTAFFYDYHGGIARGVGSAMQAGSSINNKQGAFEMKILLKWCCRVIINLVTLEKKHPHISLHQLGLALLASVLFASFCFDEAPSWLHEPLNLCIEELKFDEKVTTLSAIGKAHSSHWCPVLTHFLAVSMDSLSSCSDVPIKRFNGECKVPGLMAEFSPSTLSNKCTPSATSTRTIDTTSMNTHNPWMEALLDTLSSREHFVMSQVLTCTMAWEKESAQCEELLMYAAPSILWYTLQRRPDLSVLTSFAAQGERIASFIEGRYGDGAIGGTSSIATAAVVAAHEGGDLDAECDDDESISTSTGRHSRGDLQTLPKLDALYQMVSLRAKKASVDHLRSTLPRHCRQVKLVLSLAEEMGKGEWIQQLGNALFSSTASISVVSPSWKKQAQNSYTSALATMLTRCSGIKAGRNAASPLLTRLAFQETLVHSLWERSAYNMTLLAAQSFPSKEEDLLVLVSGYKIISSFCDIFSHHLLAVSDDEFLERYHFEGSHHPKQNDDCIKMTMPKEGIIAKDVVLGLRIILNDLYWVRPVAASDLTAKKSGPEFDLRFQRARLLLSGTKLWNSLYERWCRLYHVNQFCGEKFWWFPHMASLGQHDGNPIIHSQLAEGGNNPMDDSSVESVSMNVEAEDEAVPMSSNDAGGDALASAFRDPKMARVLTYIPQAMPFSRRVNLFNSLLESDKASTQEDVNSMHMMMNFEGEGAELPGRERVTIRRDSLYNDSKQTLNSLGKRLRKKIQVTFVNRHGREEAGIDGGGVFKEFLDDLIKDGFLPHEIRRESGNGENELSVSPMHPDFFSVTPLQTLNVNTEYDGNEAILSHYEFLGRVLGKAIYESILVEPQFCLPFLNKLLGNQNSLDDLKNLDPEYYKNLKSLRHMNAKEINELGLTFELHDSTAPTTIELMPGGSSTPVTKENIIQYIHLVSHQKMNVRGSRQTSAFLHGFREIIPALWMRVFSAYELQKLISGDDAVKGIDVQGMMSIMRYSGGLHPSQPIVQWLWQVVDEMTPVQQRKFLKFMTSCSRQPLLGFGSMVPIPCIQQTRLREDNNGNDIVEGLQMGNIRLPTSSTCMNLLKLPKYTSKMMLREKLLYAIEAAAGFELT